MPILLYVDLDLWSKSTKCWPRFKTHAALSLSTYILSLSPQSAISRSLSLCAFCPIPHYVLHVLIPHKKCIMFHYDYHWLIDNKRLRMHLFFHLYLKYNIVSINLLLLLCIMYCNKLKSLLLLVTFLPVSYLQARHEPWLNNMLQLRLQIFD